VLLLDFEQVAMISLCVGKNMTNQTWIKGNLVQGFLLLLVVALVGWLWQQGETLKKIQRENEQLRQKIAPVTTTATDSSNDMPRGSEKSSTTPQETLSERTESEATPSHPKNDPVAELVATPTGAASAPRNSGMVLADIQSSAVEGGIEATVKFSPTSNDPLGVVAVVVRLPEDRDGRILALRLVGASGLTDVSSRISDDGKFAVFNGTANQVEDLNVVLTVSDPVTADFRGTSGIGPYDLLIEANGAYATQKQ
jgi:hypothetical protein